jgi:hypothetical protein
VHGGSSLTELVVILDVLQTYSSFGDPGKGGARIKSSEILEALAIYAIESGGANEAHCLLDETLVIWGGEFGRTPTAEGTDGREHHPFGFTMWLAGGGVKGGLASTYPIDLSLCWTGLSIDGRVWQRGEGPTDIARSASKRCTRQTGAKRRAQVLFFFSCDSLASLFRRAHPLPTLATTVFCFDGKTPDLIVVGDE